jgi:hypothetical protein
MTGLFLALFLLDGPPLTERIAAAPPEIAAYLYLKQDPADRAARRTMIEEAFRLAALAKRPQPEARSSGTISPDSLAGKREEASLQHLDALGLQVRAAQAMMSIDPRRALEMTLDIPVPAAAKASCADSLLGRADEYYGLVLQMGTRGFTAEQRAQGRHLELFRRAILAASAPQQLLAAVRMVAQSQAISSNRDILITSLATALQTAPANWRGFVMTPELAAEARTLKSLAVDDAVLAYLRVQWSGEMCADSSDDITQQLPQLEENAKKPRIRDEKAATFTFWENGESKALQEALGELRPIPAKPDPAWEARVTEFLHRLESWRGDRETPPQAHFHMKAILYKNLLDYCENESLLNAVLPSFVSFLSTASAKTETPAEWLMHFRRVTLPWAPAGMKSVEVARREIRRSGDAVMNLLLDAGESF